MNSKAKGARGEREWRDQLREAGYLKSYRSQQYSGLGADSADVQAPELPFLHFEVKRAERLNVRDAYAQAQRDAKGAKIPVLAHRSNYGEWLVTVHSLDFFKLLANSQLL